MLFSTQKKKYFVILSIRPSFHVMMIAAASFLTEAQKRWHLMQMGPGQGQNGGTGWRVRNVTGTAGDVQVGVLDRPVRLEPVLVQPGGQHHEGGGTLWIGKRDYV